MPTITLSIPVRNEATYMFACMESIATQDYEGVLELIVIDGASEDTIQALLGLFNQKNPGILLENPQRIQTT